MSEKSAVREVGAVDPYVAWWPNWYVSRLHCVVGVRPDVDEARALCGWFASNPTSWRMKRPWQRRRLERETPKCAHCLRKSGMTTSNSVSNSAPPISVPTGE